MLKFRNAENVQTVSSKQGVQYAETEGTCISVVWKWEKFACTVTVGLRKMLVNEMRFHVQYIRVPVYVPKQIVYTSWTQNAHKIRERE